MGKKNDRNGFPTHLGFTKLYNILLGMLWPNDLVFLLYIVNLHTLREAKCITSKTKTSHARKCCVDTSEINKSAKLLESMGLVSIVKDQSDEDIVRWDYILDVTNYLMLINIIEDIGNFQRAQYMCGELFYSAHRRVDSITKEEIENWKKEEYR